MIVTTVVATRTTSVVWSQKDIALVQWAMRNGFVPAALDTVEKAAEFLVGAAFTRLQASYRDEIAKRRQDAYAAASAANQAAADAAIGFDPTQ